MTRPNLEDYATLIFDCDGVVLDSNSVKAEAFRAAARPWGEAAAEALVVYNAENGGISRYEKFAYFLEQIVPALATAQEGPGLDDLLSTYAAHVKAGLTSCAVAAGLGDLRARTSGARWLIASGGDQAELREVFAARGLAGYFDGGIFGSPDTKETILQRELDRGNIVEPALFLGDSKYDHVAAQSKGLDFLFVSDWSEFGGWDAYLETHQLPVVGSLSQLAEDMR